MERVQLAVADLPNTTAGLAARNAIFLDRDAAGHGWFIDPTPMANEEFRRQGDTSQLLAIDSRAIDRIDLLTVVEHELGHIAGLEDLDPSVSDLMSGQLRAGIRRSIGKADIDAIFAHEGPHGWS